MLSLVNSLELVTTHENTDMLCQEGDPEGWWEESFKSHKDSKPYGPEGISFDLQFPQTAHVYGIPEHATSLALKPTIGLPCLYWGLRFMASATHSSPMLCCYCFCILCKPTAAIAPTMGNACHKTIAAVAFAMHITIILLPLHLQYVVWCYTAAAAPALQVTKRFAYTGNVGCIF